MSNTKQTKHTPGPWTVEGLVESNGVGAFRIVSPDNTYAVADVFEIDGREANARLIAAAPDGLELADWLLDYLRRDTLGTVPTKHGIGTVVDAHLLRCKIESFINKATGGGAK